MKLIKFSRFYRWCAIGIVFTTVAAFFSERVRENLLTTWDQLQQIEAQSKIEKGCRIFQETGQREIGQPGHMTTMTMRCPDGSSPSFVVRYETLVKLSK